MSSAFALTDEVRASVDHARRGSASPKVSIVIPARNEALNLEVVLPELPSVYEVILVDGNSHDGTIDVAMRVKPDIKIVRQARRGKGNALACGFAHATGDIIVMFDADGSADPAEIPRFVDALCGGADFAKGSRFAPGGGSADITAFRRMGNSVLGSVVNRLFRIRYSDLCYGYNAFWTDIRPHLRLPDPHHVPASDAMHWGDGFEIETVINCRIASHSLAVAEVPSVERLRIHGDSNLNAVRDGLRVLRTIRTEYREHRASRRTRDRTINAQPHNLPMPYNENVVPIDA